MYACVDDGLQLTDCGSSSEACRSSTLTVPSISSQHRVQLPDAGNYTARSLRAAGKECSHSRIQCEP